MPHTQNKAVYSKLSNLLLINFYPWKNVSFFYDGVRHSVIEIDEDQHLIVYCKYEHLNYPQYWMTSSYIVKV